MPDPQLDELIDLNAEQAGLLQLVIGLLEEVADDSGAKGGTKKEKEGGNAGGFFDELREAAGSLAKMTAVASGFTYAFNPSLVAQLGQALGGLAATVGSILQPIIEVAIPVVREVSGIILDLSGALRPLIELIAGAVGEVFVAVVRAMVDVLAALMPVIEPLVKVFVMLLNAVSTIITVLSALFRAILSAVGALLGISSTDVSDALTDFKNLLYEAVRALATFAAEALELVGAMETLGKFRDNLAKTIADMKNPKAGLPKAPVGATTSGIEDISRKFSEKAFIASAGAKPKSRDTELLETIHKDLEEIIKRSGEGGLRGRAAGAADALIRAVGAPGALSVFDASAVPGAPRGGGAGAVADDVAGIADVLGRR